MDASAHDKIVQAYSDLRPIYEAFVDSLLSLFKNLLTAKRIDVVTLEGRAKEIHSFRSKIAREDKSYDDPLNEVTDLAGVRIVTYQLADIDGVSEILTSSFSVDKDNSVDKRQIVEVDRFGYVSVHYVISLNDARARLPEYSPYSGLKAEVQVRTVLQHAWAAIDHRLRYKTKEEAPLNLRRRLFRISALLETADSEFDLLRAETAKIRKKYAEDVAHQRLSIPLDIESISVYAQVSAVVADIVNSAKRAGYLLVPYTAATPSSRQEFVTLLEDLNSCMIGSILEVDRVLQRAMTQVPELLPAVLKSWNEPTSKSEPNLKLVVNRETLLRVVFPLGLAPAERHMAISRMRFGKLLDRAFRSAYAKVKDV